MNKWLHIILVAVAVLLLVLVVALGRMLDNQRVPEATGASSATQSTQDPTLPNFTIPNDTWEATPWG